MFVIFVYDKKKMILVAVTGVRGLHHFHARNVEL